MDDLEDMGRETFNRSLAEVGIESFMQVGFAELSRSRPFVWTGLFDEGRTDPGAPGTEVML
ncbi:hypothetical protein [Mycetocola saprophilus]|uniref:hypothetical protein n=1 Tax=Mycetocola saprophilus TaxID=76636 RepID=UPI0004BEB6DE|nr:hypothetical protein [Mycetocola saprophilus]